MSAQMRCPGCGQLGGRNHLCRLSDILGVHIPAMPDVRSTYRGRDVTGIVDDLVMAVGKVTLLAMPTSEAIANDPRAASLASELERLRRVMLAIEEATDPTTHPPHA